MTQSGSGPPTPFTFDCTGGVRYQKNHNGRNHYGCDHNFLASGRTACLWKYYSYDPFFPGLPYSVFLIHLKSIQLSHMDFFRLDKKTCTSVRLFI